MKIDKKVIVIGAGFSGISTASHLAKAGFQVTVLEKHDQAGGRARVFEQEGFLFDMGPSWYWMPDVFDRYFESFGKKTAQMYELQRLSPSYRVFWQENDQTDVPSDLKKLADLFEALEPGSSLKLKQFLEEAEYKYEVGMRDMVYKPGIALTEYLDTRFIKGIFTTHLFTSFSKFIRRYFSNPKILQLLEFPVLFLGARPKDIPALYSLMNYADMVLGTWYPKGGMGKIVDAMVKVAIEQGVVFNYEEEVYRIDCKQKKAYNVHTSKGDHSCDYVVAAADYHHVDQNLLEPQYRNYSVNYWKNRVMAPSCALFYLGVKGRIEGLLHHNLFFDADFDVHAEAIYAHPDWPKQPLFYVCAPSKSDPLVAPEGHENLFVLIPVAPGLKNSSLNTEHYFNLVMERLEERVGYSIRQNIVFRRDYTGANFIADYNAFRGNAYGLANTLLQTGPLKPKVKNKHLNNFYYTGQLTAPGPGVPPALISGEVVANEIISQEKRINKGNKRIA